MKRIIVLGALLCAFNTQTQASHNVNTVTLLNYTDKTVQAAYAPPGASCDFEDRSSECEYHSIPAKQPAGFTITATPKGLDEYDSGTLTVSYRDKETDWQNPRPGMTYQVSFATDGSLVIEGSSPRSNVHYKGSLKEQ